MFLSVAVPVYNAEQYINKCIQSIMSQTYQDFELILVDDGSKDKSAEICKKWKENYPERIRFVQKENSGSLLTRRVCLKEATGKYIYIADADDYLLDENAFQKIVKAIESTKCDLLFFNATVTPNHTPYIQYPFKNMEEFSGAKLDELYKLMCEGDRLNSLWNKVFSREMVDWNTDYRGFSKVTNGTDMFQMIPILFKAQKVVFMEDVLYFYRIDNNCTSIVHTFKKTIYVSLRENFLRLYDYAAKLQPPLENMETILANRYMKIVGTSIFKIRMIDARHRDAAYQYLEEMRDDPLFQQMYLKASMHEVPKVKALLATCLYQKWYWLLWILCQGYQLFR